MKNLKLVTMLALTLGLGTAAEAATVLYTSAMVTDLNVTYPRCVLTNVTDDEITVRVEILNSAGGVTLDSGEITVAPGATTANFLGMGTINVCRFTVPSRKKVRAQGCINRMGMTTCETQFDAY